MNGADRADVAVVGAGIIGCLAACEIAERAPDASVVVLDAAMIGSGATARSAGLHVARGGTERVRRMAAASEDRYTGLRAARPSLPIHPLDLWIVAAESGADRLREVYLERARLARADGPPGGDLVRVPAGAGVWRGEGAQRADVRGVSLAIAAELRPRVRFREGVRVTAIEPGAGGVALGLGTGETLAVERVVVAPGPWVAAEPWRELTAPLGVRVKKIVATHVESRPSEGDGAILFEDEDAFLLPLVERGHWLFSYTCLEWDVDPDAPTLGLSARNLAEARECLGRYAPGLIERCAAGRVFCDAYSPDREPVVRTLDDWGRVVFAGAANGSGYRLAPAIAAEAAALVA